MEVRFSTCSKGLSPRDNTVDVVEKLLDYKVAGISEAIRNFGQMRLPTSMLSRAVAVIAEKMLIVTLTGSTGGVQDGLNAILPHVFHARKIILGGGH